MFVIAILKGKVVEREAKALIVDVQGVGYRVAVLSPWLSTVKLDDEVTLRIHHQVTDDAENLYGFSKKEDLRYFELLLTVPSVGPRTAMNILEIAPPETLARAVASRDVKLLTKVSGIGRKTADRIMVELKEKFKDVKASEPVGEMQEEVISALTNMGFTKGQAREAVQKLPAEANSVEEAIRFVLQGR